MNVFLGSWIILSLVAVFFNYACSKVSNPNRK